MPAPDETARPGFATQAFAIAYMIVIFGIALADLLFSLTEAGGFLGEPLVFILLLFAVFPFLLVSAELRQLAERIDALEKKAGEGATPEEPAAPEGEESPQAP
jgi:hypothetical protein